MPPLPPVPQVLQVKLKGTSGEATPLPWENVLHFSYSGSAPTVAACNAIAAQVNTSWVAHMAAECVNNVSLNEVQVVDLTSSTAAAGFSGVVASGTRGDDELPANVAFLINYPIARRYRGGHPRTYLYVLGTADFLDAAHWSSAATAEVGTHWTAFLDAIIGFTNSGCTIANLMNVSYYSGIDPVTKKPIRRVTPVTDVITVADLIPEQQMASQRRRIGRKRR